MDVQPAAPCEHNGSEPAKLGLGTFVLHRTSGEDVTLHRFAGRWLVLHLVHHLHEARSPDGTPPADALTLTVVSGKSAPNDGTIPGDAVFFDPDLQLQRLVPGMTLPATLVIDAVGELAAIVTDKHADGVVHTLLSSNPRRPAHGSLSLGDIGR